MTLAPERPGLTVEQLRASLRRRLRRAKGGADIEARMLVGHALGLDAGSVPLHDERVVTAGELAAVEALVVRREAGEPVARLLGRQEFWGLDFDLGPETLVPRADTETVVEAAFKAIAARGWTDRAITILDLGVGSGAILLSLLSELPQAIGIGVDRAFGAALVARRNAARLGLGPRCGIMVGDWDEALSGRADAIVSNPPYIRREDIAGLDIEVREHDPILALDGGGDGFEGHRAVLGAAGRLLGPEGFALVEVGFDQAATLAGMAERLGWNVRLHPDLRGVSRVVELARR